MCSCNAYPCCERVLVHHEARTDDGGAAQTPVPSNAHFKADVAHAKPWGESKSRTRFVDWRKNRFAAVLHHVRYPPACSANRTDWPAAKRSQHAANMVWGGYPWDARLPSLPSVLLAGSPLCEAVRVRGVCGWGVLWPNTGSVAWGILRPHELHIAIDPSPPASSWWPNHSGTAFVHKGIWSGKHPWPTAAFRISCDSVEYVNIVGDITGEASLAAFTRLLWLVGNHFASFPRLWGASWRFWKRDHQR